MKRKLGWFGLGFAGAELAAANLPPLVCVPAAAFLVCLALLWIKRRRDSAIPVLGALCGLAWFLVFTLVWVRPVKALAGQTVNNIFSFMRSAINHAIATSMWSGVNPLSTKGGTWKMVTANNERLRFLTREEAKALLDDLEKRHPQLHDMALLSLRTGLRPTEIFKLRGQDVDANACGLHIIQKGGKRVFVRVPEDMIRMLQAYRRKPAEPIFQQPRKKTAFTKTPACFQTAVRKLGLAPEDGDSLYAVTLHTMRHTFASWLAQSGKVTLMELQKLMRHKNITMTMRYAHLFPGQESEKLSIIGDMLA